MEFEKKLKELEETVARFNQKDLSLEDGIRLFEDGLQLTKECLNGLKEAKEKVSVIRGELDQLMEEPFKE